MGNEIGLRWVQHVEIKKNVSRVHMPKLFVLVTWPHCCPTHLSLAQRLAGTWEGGLLCTRLGRACQTFLVPRPTPAVSGPNRRGCPTELVHHVAQRCPPNDSANLPGAEKATILVDGGRNVSNPHSPSYPFCMRWVASCSFSSLPGFSPPNPSRLQSDETRPPPLRLDAATNFSFPSLAEERNQRWRRWTREGIAVF